MLIIDERKIMRLNNDNLIYDSFDKNIIFFFKEISDLIFSNKKYRLHSDLIAFAYWARPENLNNIRLSIKKNNYFKGRGLVFHVTPSNVPTNFVYSLAFGLICGNSNIIKIPSKKFVQIDLLISIILKILNKKNFKKFKKRVIFIKYDTAKKNISEYLSFISDARMVWGSDDTINFFKSLKTQIHCKDLFFYDKYSFSIINSKKLLDEKKNIKLITKKFYNDTLLFDQNACSSPHIIFWYGNNKNYELAKNLFWNSLSSFVDKNYDNTHFKIIYKHSKYTYDVMNLKNIKNVKRYNNDLFVVDLKNVDIPLFNLKGKFGYFYQTKIQSFSKFNKFLSHKIQTLLYFGLEFEDLNKILKIKNKRGIDRIAPFGKSMQINFSWDGYNIFSELTSSTEIIK